MVQGDALNRSRLATVGLRHPDEQHEVGEGARERPAVAELTGLPKESVANVSQLVTLDKADLAERTGKLCRAKLDLVLSGIDVVLGR